MTKLKKGDGIITPKPSTTCPYFETMMKIGNNTKCPKIKKAIDIILVIMVVMEIVNNTKWPKLKKEIIDIILVILVIMVVIMVVIMQIMSFLVESVTKIINSSTKPICVICFFESHPVKSFLVFIKSFF